MNPVKAETIKIAEVNMSGFKGEADQSKLRASLLAGAKVNMEIKSSQRRKHQHKENFSFKTRSVFRAFLKMTFDHLESISDRFK